MDYMGPVRLKDVEEAQDKIISIIRYLEERGEIIIARGEDEMVYGKCPKPEFRWEDLLTINDDDIKRIIAKADYQTLLISLKLASPKIINKFTKSFGFFKRLIFKRDIQRLNTSIDAITYAQHEIITIYLYPPSPEDTEDEDDLDLDLEAETETDDELETETKTTETTNG